MATPYSQVYDAFLSKITDYDRAQLTDEVLEADMDKLLDSALPYFRLSRIGLQRDYLNRSFVNTLDNDEIQIIATLMKREWYKRFIANTDVTLQKFADTDFEFKSQANHLKALVSGETEVLDKEIKRLLSDYDRVDFEGNLFDYTRLAGKHI